MAVYDVKATTNYDKFKFLTSNREMSGSHVAALKEALQDHPEILEAQPILINEKFEIIDGQHRFAAAQELGLAIYYTMVEGIGIETARMMNILQRRWTPQDFADSYAKTGNKNYVAYQKAKEDFGLPHNITLYALSNSMLKGLGADFRKGYFEVKDEKLGRMWLERITEVRKYSKVPMITPYMTALLVVFQNEAFNYDRFLEKLKASGDLYLRRANNEQDYLRMIEEIYNLDMRTRIRLF